MLSENFLNSLNLGKTHRYTRSCSSRNNVRIMTKGISNSSREVAYGLGLVNKGGRELRTKSIPHKRN